MTLALWTSAPVMACDATCDRSERRVLDVALVPSPRGVPDLSCVRTLDDFVPPQPSHLGTALPEEGFVVGHNLACVWPLLQPNLTTPLAAIDTVVMARELGIRRANGVGALVHRYGVRHRLTALVPDSRPRQTLWNAVAVGLVLGRMVTELWGRSPTIWELWHQVGFTLGPARVEHHVPDQASSGFRAALRADTQTVSTLQTDVGWPRR